MGTQTRHPRTYLTGNTVSNSEGDPSGTLEGVVPTTPLLVTTQGLDGCILWLRLRVVARTTVQLTCRGESRVSSVKEE